jgi:Copper transport outer membrane protein, MctB
VIDFRYHLVSIVAVFLALAIGIVLGTTELQGPAYNILNSTTGKLQNELDQANSQRDAAQQQASLGDQYAQAVEPVVLNGLLAGQRLLIVTEPGASASAVAGISSAAAVAGATVTGQIALQNKFFDTSATTLDSLNQVNQDMAAHAGIALQSGETYQQQAAQVIASQILAKSTESRTSQQTTVQQPSSGPEPDAQPVLAAYANLGFLTISGQPYTQATLAVIVTPQTAPSDGGADPLAQLLVPVAEELAGASSGTVVAGTSAGSGPGSPVAVLRSNNASNQVSTVDDADLVAGQTVVIQALAVLLNGGKAGSYGFTSNGASAVAPTPAPTASPSASTSTTPPAGGKKKASK